MNSFTHTQNQSVPCIEDGVQLSQSEKLDVDDNRTTLSLMKSTKNELRSACEYPKYIDSDEDRILFIIDRIKDIEKGKHL